jgi:hypothetical protein
MFKIIQNVLNWSKLSQNCPKIVPKLTQNCPKIVPKLSQNCPKIVPKLSQNCPKLFFALNGKVEMFFALWGSKSINLQSSAAYVDVCLLFANNYSEYMPSIMSPLCAAAHNRSLMMIIANNQPPTRATVQCSGLNQRQKVQN